MRALAGTPLPVFTKLNQDFASVLRMPEVHRRLEKMGVDAKPKTPEEFNQFIRTEVACWAKVIKDAGIPQQ